MTETKSWWELAKERSEIFNKNVFVDDYQTEIKKIGMEGISCVFNEAWDSWGIVSIWLAAACLQKQLHEKNQSLIELNKKVEAQAAQIAELTKIFNEKIQTLQLSRALLIAGELRKHPELSQAKIAKNFGLTSAAVSQIALRYNLRKPKEKPIIQQETSPTGTTTLTAPAGAQL